MAVEEQPLVSVIIPTFNRAELVREAVLCVLEQSYRNLEIIVVDDASTDSTGEVIQAIDDARVNYVRLDRNSGPSGARNAGVRSATGNFVSFLDSDDNWDTRKTAVQLEALRRQPEPQHTVSYTRAVIVRSADTYELPTRAKYDDEPVADYVCGDEGLIHTSSLMLSRELALANPFPTDQKVFEDWDLFLRLEAKGVSWLYIDQPLITWNNDYRPDRLTLSVHEGSLWLDEHRDRMSRKARHAFALKGIVGPLIRARQRKLYSLNLLVQAFFNGAIPADRFAKMATKIFVPPAILKPFRAGH